MEPDNRDNRIDYVEFASTNIEPTKSFYTAVFGWSFTDWGPDYTSFEDGRLSGGFRKADSISQGGPLVVIYTRDISRAETRVKSNGGTIVKGIFSFPGGRRFHFSDPSGNELAVWSDEQGM